MGAEDQAVRRSPHVLFASTEAYPLAKTGGLADVSAALPASLAKLGIDVRLILPAYVSALDAAEDKVALVLLPNGARVIRGRMPGTGLPIYLIDRPDLYRRSGGPYQDADRNDWSDNHVRFALFCDAIVHIAQHGDGAGWQPDLVHTNDWCTGLVPARLALESAGSPPTVFTVHNMAFQGNFPLAVVQELGLPAELHTVDGAEFHGQLSFLKAAIRYSHRLTTVSPTYAMEILTPEYGAGLDGVLRSRANDLVGILNGVDYNVWDPTNDQNLPHRYSVGHMAGKGACKAALQEQLGLNRSDDIPLVNFINRLTHQKMADVVLQSLPGLAKQRLQFVLHGDGERSLEDAFMAAAGDRSERLAVCIGYREPFAHSLNAAADIALAPSRFEPCGLTAMYAMRYGTPPVTRPVGGLVDTVVDAGGADEVNATGYTFTQPTVEELVACVERACADFRNKAQWCRIQRNAMLRDFSWARSARQYARIYRELVPTVAWGLVDLDEIRDSGATTQIRCADGDRSASERHT